METLAEKTLARVRLTALELPEAVEEKAWAGIRWCVRKKNFAHLVSIDAGWPPAYAQAAATQGPAHVLTFRLRAENCQAARFTRAPFFRPVWFPNIAGVVLDAHPDWDEVDGLIRESYQVLAPRKLAAMLE
jgi:hypothetical protein